MQVINHVNGMDFIEITQTTPNATTKTLSETWQTTKAMIKKMLLSQGIEITKPKPTQNTKIKD